MVPTIKMDDADSWQCFKQGQGRDAQLVVAYSMTPAYG